MGGEWLKPGMAAQRLVMPASTLRVYSTKFASLLSPSASEPVAASGGKRRSRLYSSTDIAILSRAKELLSRGITYEQALDELLFSVPGARGRASPPTPSTGAESPPGVGAMAATQTEAMIKAMIGDLVTASVAHYERLVQEWHSLAEERASESLQLRGRLRELEQELRVGQASRNGWLLRVSAG